MTVTLELEAASHDITEYLDDDSDIVLAQEHELKAFLRTVDDVRLKCSNLDGEFSTWLGAPSSVKPRIRIDVDEETLFRGEIEQPVTFNIVDEWINFDCFSLTKAFWEICTRTRVSKAEQVQSREDLYSTVQAILEYEITQERFGHLLRGLQIASQYAGRQIRWSAYTADERTGNHGRYTDLDPRTTLDELLKAMTVYYNADIFIDPQTQLLVMTHRDEILNDVNHQLDDNLEDDEAIDVQVCEEKVDYISLALNATKPTAPSFGRQYNRDSSKFKGLAKGRYRWAVTFVYRLGDKSSESNLGDKTESHELSGGDPNPNPGAPSQNISYVYGMRLTDIKTGPQGCIARRIYRTRNTGDGTFFLAGSIDNNSDTLYDDYMPDNELGGPATEGNPSGMIWMSYDETVDGWNADIYGDTSELNTPTGNIFDIAPKLRFRTKPLGYGIEIAAIYAYNGRTRIRTKVEHNIDGSSNPIVYLHHTNCVPPFLDGTAYKVSEVFDALTFDIANMSPVTQPGTAGTVIRSEDVDKEQPQELVEDLFYTFAFFGHEIDSLDVLRDQWMNLFRSRKRVRMTAKGLAYRVGDSASLNRTYNGLTIGKCVIKKAKNNLFKERTQIEMLTL